MIEFTTEFVRVRANYLWERTCGKGRSRESLLDRALHLVTAVATAVCRNIILREFALDVNTVFRPTVERGVNGSSGEFGQTVSSYTAGRDSVTPSDARTGGSVVSY